MIVLQSDLLPFWRLFGCQYYGSRESCRYFIQNHWKRNLEKGISCLRPKRKEKKPISCRFCCRWKRATPTFILEKEPNHRINLPKRLYCAPWKPQANKWMMKIYANWWKKTVLTTFNASQYYWNSFRTIYCETKKTSFAHTNGYSAYWYDSKWFSKISGMTGSWEKQLKDIEKGPAVLVPLSIIWSEW
jgi:hypothetical protein